jgi:hypothetical protein
LVAVSSSFTNSNYRVYVWARPDRSTTCILITCSFPYLSKELLITTRAVRKRLDLDSPVEREVIEECVAIAQQAHTASKIQNWHFSNEAIWLAIYSNSVLYASILETLWLSSSNILSK